MTILGCLLMAGGSGSTAVVSAQGKPAARQVWAGSDVDYEGNGAPSPDGRFLPFTNWDTGDVGVRDLKTNSTRLITHSGGWDATADFARHEIVSPDGRWVAYHWEAVGETADSAHWELRISPLDGRENSPARTIYRTPDFDEQMWPAGWTSNGMQILAVHILPDHRTSQFVLISVNDGSIRMVKEFTAWRPGRPSLSPDSKYIAYPMAIGTKPPGIFLLSIDGKRETPLMEHPAFDVQPLWTPDGSHIVFLSSRSGTSSVWSVPISNGKAAGDPTLIKPDLRNAVLQGISHTGALYYTFSGETKQNVYLADLGPDGKATGPPRLLTDAFVNHTYGAAWSSDGRSVAYSTDNGGGVRVRSMESGEERGIFVKAPVITPFGSPPVWFPDNRHFLVLSPDNQQPGTRCIRVDVTTGEVELVYRYDGAISSYDLAPDGKTMFILEQGIQADTGRLVRVDLETRQATDLRKGDWFITVKVSPDGKLLAYLVSERRPGRGSHIAVIPSTGGEPKEVFHKDRWGDGQRYNTLGWSPDQKYILVGQQEGRSPHTTTEFWRVPSTGGQAEKTGISFTGGQIKAPRFSPDGRKLTYGVAADNEAEVWVLENLLPKPGRR